MSDEKIVVDGFDETQFGKPTERKAIDDARKVYLAEGGTIKRFIPPFMPENFIHCDTFVAGEGSTQSQIGIKDTKVRIPRPEKKWQKK